jgi:hypothetical protein
MVMVGLWFFHEHPMSNYFGLFHELAGDFEPGEPTWVNLGDGYQTVVTPGFGPQRKTIPTEPPLGGSIKQKIRNIPAQGRRKEDDPHPHKSRLAFARRLYSPQFPALDSELQNPDSGCPIP